MGLVEARLEDLENPVPEFDQECLAKIDASATPESIAMNASGVLTLEQAFEACGDAGVDSGGSKANAPAAASAPAIAETAPASEGDEAIPSQL
jgi:hypothetical protein